jgi:integrase
MGCVTGILSPTSICWDTRSEEEGDAARGQGTITRRKDGRWEARYNVHTADGPKRQVLYGKTRAEVAEKLTKAMVDRYGGLVFDSGTLTVGEYLDRWITGSLPNTVRQSTYVRYEGLVRNHIKPAIGRVKLKALTPTHVRALYREKLEKLSPRSVNYIHVTLHKALKQAVHDGLVPRNVTDAVKVPQAHREEINPLSLTQVKTLLSAARGDRLEALYVLAVHTGLRQGELLAGGRCGC